MAPIIAASLISGASSIMAANQPGGGGGSGSHSSESKTLLSPTQRAGLDASVTGLKNLQFQGQGQRQSTAVDQDAFNQLRQSTNLQKFQDEGRLSVQGIGALRDQQAQMALNAAPGGVGQDVRSLRQLGGMDSPYQMRLQEQVRKAQDALGKAEIGNLRMNQGRGTLHSSSRQAALREMGGDYARTVGQAASTAVEQAEAQRRAQALQAYGSAGQLGLGTGNIAMQSAIGSGQLDVSRLGIGQQDLSQRRNLRQGTAQYLSGMSSADIGQANLWNQQGAASQNQFGLSRLQALAQASGVQGMENVVYNTPPSAGVWPAALEAQGNLWGSYLANPNAEPLWD